MAKIVPQGEAVIRAHLEHLLGHGEEELYRQAVGYLTEHAVPVPSHSTPGAPAACPGSAVRTLPDTAPQGPRDDGLGTAAIADPALPR